MVDPLATQPTRSAGAMRPLVSCVAALALVSMPVTAQANSRASTATVSLVSAAQEPETLARMAAASDMMQDDCDDDGIVNDLDDDDDCGGGLAWLVYGGVGIALIAIIFAVAGSGGKPPLGGDGGARSPGTGN